MDYLRSCYSSSWLFPENPAQEVQGYFYFADPGTPHYPDWHYFGSRNWHENDGTPEPQFGEQNITQRWRNGSFPVKKPPAVLIGRQDCIENGNDVDPPAPRVLIFGVDSRCWPVPPIGGGLAIGGPVGARVRAFAGGLALGKRPFFPAIPHGGIALGGAGRGQVAIGGLLLAGLDRGQRRGGLTLGGLDRGKREGGLKLDGAGSGQVVIPTNAIQYAFAQGHTTGQVSLNATWPHATTAGSLLIAVVAGKGTAFPPVDNAAPGWTATAVSNQAIISVRVFYIVNAASQTTTGAFASGNVGDPTDAILLVGEYHPGSGGGLDKSVQSNGPSGNPSTAVTGTLAQAAETLVAGFVINAANTFGAPGGGWSIGIQKTQGSMAAALIDKIVSSTASQSTSSAATNTGWATSLDSWKT